MRNPEKSSVKSRIKKFIVTNNLLGKTQKNKFESEGFYYYSGQRATFTEGLKYVKEPGRALDIGAGFGNEVKELLKRGCEVVAIDPNEEAVKYLQKVAKKQPKLSVLHQALPDFPEGKFDFIVCEMVLHFLSKKVAYESIKKMQAATNSGGLNVISSYLEQPSIHTDPRIKPGYFTFLLEAEELKKLYKDWEMLYYEEKQNAMSLDSARMVARKR